MTRHRLLVGADPAHPSGLERRRMRDAALDASTPRSRGRAAGRLAALAAAAAATTAAAVAIVPQVVSTPAPPDAEWIAARGPLTGAFDERLVGLGLAGVTEDGVEYEAIASRAAYLDDYLRLSYTNERPDLGHLFVFGLQPDRDADSRLTWIAPLPSEGESIAIGGAWLRPLFEVRLGARHEPGPLRVVAIFSRRPLAVDAVARAVDASVSDLVPSELAGALKARLRLSDDAVVRVLDTHVHPGSLTEEEHP